MPILAEGSVPTVCYSNHAFNNLSTPMQLVQLHLPYPPSTNRYWRTFRGRTVPSKEATAFKKIVKEAGPAQDLYTGEVSLTIQLLPKLTAKGLASKVCMDLDNCLKVIGDSIQGVYIENDKQIRLIVAEYGDPIQDGGVIVTVCKMK